MNKTIIIAEAGVNHNGDLNLAKKLIEVAAKAGADYVKFQTFKAEKLVQKNAGKADYQINNTHDSGSQFDMLKKLELNDKDHYTLIDHCQTCGIKFLSTAFDLESVEFLKDKLDFYKIPSGEITNLPYLERVAKLRLPVVMSSGMATLDEVKEALSVLVKNGVLLENTIVLHCNTEYPTPMHDVNLRAMLHIASRLGVKVGYSDHTLGIEVPIAAVSLGACVIEKHFTLDRNMEGPDHAASLEPEELIAMVNAIRNIESALSGSGKKEPSPSEQKNIVVARKSIIAIKDIKKGEFFSVENIAVKRPGTGISPMKWYEVLGRTSKRNFRVDEMIEL